MRLLHTSDWHLGQSLHHYDRSHEHQCFLDWLLDTLESEAIDALLIAGDIFDNANPSAQAQRLFYRFLAAAKQRLPRLDILLIAGNHDSPARLEAPSPLFEVFDARAIGQVTRDAEGRIELERLLVPLRNREREVAAWCLAVPFLRPGDLPRLETQGDAYLAGIERLYHQVLDLALERREPGQAILALGHCHLSGGTISADSERRLIIGGAEALPVEIFDPAIAYTALGHLHRAQNIGGLERVRYAGSPLPLSFAEVQYRHQVVRVDLDSESLATTVPLPVPRWVDLLRVPKQHAPLDEVLNALLALELPETPLIAQPYLEVRVRLEAPEPGLRARIESVLEGKPVRLARIDPTYGRQNPATAAEGPQSLDDLGRLQPEDLFRKLHHGRHGAEPATRLLEAFRELWLHQEDEA